MADTYTTAYNLVKPDFDKRLWHEKLANNFDVIDGLFASILGTTNFRGVWENSTAYAVGERVVDPETSTIYICDVAHTSPTTGTLQTFLVSYATYWSTLGSSTTNAFYAYQTIAQSIDSGANVLVNFQATDISIGSTFSTTTGRWTPGRTGIALLGGTVDMTTVSTTAFCNINIRRNGVVFRAAGRRIAASGRLTNSFTTMIPIAAATDYFDMTVIHNAGVALDTITDTAGTAFFGLFLNGIGD